MYAVGRIGPARALAGLLVVTGTLHFLTPAPMVAIVPQGLPRPELLVAVSGVAELGCAALLAVPGTRRIGGALAAALFAAVYPANVSMALRSGDRAWWYRVLCWLRLPLQWPLIVAGVRVARSR